MVDKQRQEYNRRWVVKNGDKIKAYHEKTKERRNARRRELYAKDEYRRTNAIKSAKEYRENNPTARRNNDLLNKYGISLEEYTTILESQNGGCAICGRSQNIDSEFGLHVDHDHDTGKVRGILCSSCNLGLGKFAHECDRLKNAIAYLEAHDDG